MGRIVAFGNPNEYGVDYDETFAPVGKVTALQNLLAHVASRSCLCFKWASRFKNTFLHGDL